jgi:hypothetical protein
MFWHPGTDSQLLLQPTILLSVDTRPNYGYESQPSLKQKPSILPDLNSCQLLSDAMINSFANIHPNTMQYIPINNENQIQYSRHANAKFPFQISNAKFVISGDRNTILHAKGDIGRDIDRAGTGMTSNDGG